MSPRAGWLALLLATAALAACAPAPTPAPDDGERYTAWYRSHTADAYLTYLRGQGLDRVLPPQQLLRSGGRMRRGATSAIAAYAAPTGSVRRYRLSVGAA